MLILFSQNFIICLVRRHLLRLHLVIYRDLRDQKFPQDEKILESLKFKCQKWTVDETSNRREIVRAIPLTKESVTAVDLHVLVEPSIVANCTVVYGNIYFQSKLCISKKNLTIPKSKACICKYGL